MASASKCIIGIGAVMLLLGLVGCPGTLPSGGISSSDEEDPKNPNPLNFNVFSLRVGRHVDQPLSDRDVDEVFFEASRVLQTFQSDCPDVATNVTFLREGPVESFNVGEAVITTERQLDAVFDQPHDIKVVHGLVGVCGIELPASVATILGCATAGGSLVIIADAPPDVWAHEWGHVQGLRHRDDCPRNLMHSFEVETNAVNQTESLAFLRPNKRAKLIQVESSEPWVDPADHLIRETNEPLDAWLGRIVGRRYLAGVPSQLADKCDATAVSRLRAWCNNVAPQNSEANIIRLLGLAGDAGACQLLTRRVLAGAGELTRAEFNAVAEAFLALGRLVEYDAGGLALTFLIEGADPQTWAQRSPQWRFGAYEGAKLHRLLARLSILALGLSNSEEALAHLEMLRQDIDAGLLPADEFADQVDEALARMRQDAPSQSRKRVLRLP